MSFLCVVFQLLAHSVESKCQFADFNGAIDIETKVEVSLAQRPCSGD